MKLYGELAEWWPLLSAPSEYEGEASLAADMLRQHARREIREVLELGSGGGNNASYLKRSFDMTLVDLAPGMLAVSRALNPECEHVEGDMRTVRLDRRFDAVFVHDAVMYMRTEDDLRAAMVTAREHCRPGGVALFTPDFIRETFAPETSCGGHDGDDGRAVRYLDWTTGPGPSGSEYIVDYAVLVRDRDGSVRVLHDRHVEGLFDQATWLRTLRDAGFDDAQVVREPDDVDWDPRDVFIGIVDESRPTAP